MFNKFYIIFLFLMLTTTGCGFKVVNQSERLNFKITEIESSGERRINFRIKNALIESSTSNNNNEISLKLRSYKDKSVKEKNNRNEATKYQININVEIDFNEMKSSKNGTFSVKDSGDYNVESQYSDTLNNEKKLIEIITDKLVDKILDELVLKINAL